MKAALQRGTDTPVERESTPETGHATGISGAVGVGLLHRLLEGGTAFQFSVD